MMMMMMLKELQPGSVYLGGSYHELSKCNHPSDSTSVCFMRYYLSITDPKPLPLNSFIHLEQSSGRKLAFSNWTWFSYRVSDGTNLPPPLADELEQIKVLGGTLIGQTRWGNLCLLCGEDTHSSHTTEVTHSAVARPTCAEDVDNRACGVERAGSRSGLWAQIGSAASYRLITTAPCRWGVFVSVQSN